MIDWKTKLIGEVVADIRTGSTPSTSHPEFFSGSISWFTPGDVGATRELTKSSRHITEQALKAGKAKLFEKDMLLVTCIGDIGRVGILHQPSSSNQQITALKFTDEIDVRYAYYWFITYRNRLERLANQAVVPILNNERLKEVEFFYPPLPEQKRIAAILDKADRLRRLRRYALELGDTYLQSVFLEMFGDPVTNPNGWEIAPIEKVLSKTRTGTQTGPFGSSLKRHEYVAKGIPVWGINNMMDNEFVEEGSLFITPEKYRELINYSVESGDILVSRAGTVGRMCVARPTTSPSIIGTNLIRISLDTDLMSPEYFTALFTYFGKQVGHLKMSSDEDAYSFINPRMLKMLEIQLPPIDTQTRFVCIVHKHARLRAQQREAERQAEHLFQSLLHRAFAGEL